MEDTIILNGIEEIGNLFHNRMMLNIGINSIMAKDYPVSYPPIKIFDVIGNSRKHILKIVDEKLGSSVETDEVEKKWKKTVYDGAIIALYRANLEYLDFDIDQIEGLETEKDILWKSFYEEEAAIIPDTSALMDGLISRLIEGEEDEIKGELNVYLTYSVIKELERHAEGRQKQIEIKNDPAKTKLADVIRKARIAIRALSELVEYRNSKKLRVKVIETKYQDKDVPDWNILLEAKSLNLDMPKFFVTNDLIQSTLANLMGLKTVNMYPTHFAKLKEISLTKNEVGRAFYELAIQFGEIILETKTGDIQFILQSDWPNKMSPSWVNKILFAKIKYEDSNFREEFIKIVNRKRISYEKIKDFDPRMKTLL